MATKPITGEEILTNDHSASNHDGIGDAQMAITGKPIAAEDEAADDGLQQVVGEAHTPEDAEVMEHTAYARESIPGRHHSRDDHQQDDEVVDGLEPRFEFAEIHETQRKDDDGRANKNAMPDL